MTEASEVVKPVAGSISSTLVAKVDVEEDGAQPIRVPRAFENATLHRFRTGSPPMTGKRSKLGKIVGKE